MPKVVDGASLDDVDDTVVTGVAESGALEDVSEDADPEEHADVPAVKTANTSNKARRCKPSLRIMPTAYLRLSTDSLRYARAYSVGLRSI